MPAQPRKVVRCDPPQPAWLRFQPGGWAVTVVRTWQLRDDGWWAEVDYTADGKPITQTWVRAEQLRRRDPSFPIGRTHRCIDPP